MCIRDSRLILMAPGLNVVMQMLPPHHTLNRPLVIDICIRARARVCVGEREDRYKIIARGERKKERERERERERLHVWIHYFCACVCLLFVYYMCNLKTHTLTQLYNCLFTLAVYFNLQYVGVLIILLPTLSSFPILTICLNRQNCCGVSNQWWQM